MLRKSQSRCVFAFLCHKIKKTVTGIWFFLLRKNIVRRVFYKKRVEKPLFLNIFFVDTKKISF
jgi:hypothetical protein